MCLGGHLAYRCALDTRIAAAVCYFATDIHSHTLGEGMKDDSLDRAGDIKGELVMVRKASPIETHDRLRTGDQVDATQIFGKKDNHVPPDGRDLIRKTLHEKGITFSFYEAAWAQRRYLFCQIILSAAELP